MHKDLGSSPHSPPASVEAPQVVMQPYGVSFTLSTAPLSFYLSYLIYKKDKMAIRNGGFTGLVLSPSVNPGGNFLKKRLTTATGNSAGDIVYSCCDT